MKKKKVIIFAKEKYGLNDALLFLRKHFAYVRQFKGNRKDVFPKDAYRSKYDICISYMSPWIIPEKFIKSVKEFSINFHPGSPRYRGVGCTNFAIYDSVRRYGVTAHLMAPRVDSGEIINVKYFTIRAKDSLIDVTQRCYQLILKQFFEIFYYYLKFDKLPKSKEKWGKHLYTRKELNELCRIKKGMKLREVKRRVEATNFPNMPKAYLEMHGFRFEYKE